MIALLLQIPTVPATSSTAMDFTWLFLQMFFALAAVTVLAIFILKFIVPRMGMTKRFKRNQLFQVHGRFALEPKKNLYLLEVAKKYFVIGTSESGIDKIAELESHDIEDQPK
ncbi:MAG: hypothetical protein A3I05_03425 [Deltaproteobacteria bacterium RIFCSPLOWO2_02_FULL_44_10]|nr:MAG: hypothetical protein A3I05_03425 [Deltaproteobacteria bacterium RIFCSPLOWO2_02_FULL_44_10]